eukprot:g1792.t1
MHNRRRRKREERNQRLNRVFAQVLPGLTEIALQRTDIAPLKLDWEQLPAALDPGRNGKAGYALPQARAERKRAQVESLLAIAAVVLPDSGEAAIVEFGAGCGHVGLLLAHLYPKCTVTLVERKRLACDQATERAKASQIDNVTVFCGDIASFRRDCAGFDIGVGLHCCGALTDAALAACVECAAAAVICPCCYGQLAAPPAAADASGEVPAAAVVPVVAASARSIELAPLSAVDFETLCRAADFSVGGSSGGWDLTKCSNFKIAKRCMILVDLDRVLAISQKEGQKDYVGWVTSLGAYNSSPKNNCIVMLPSLHHPAATHLPLAQMSTAYGVLPANPLVACCSTREEVQYLSKVC